MHAKHIIVGLATLCALGAGACSDRAASRVEETAPAATQAVSTAAKADPVAAARPTGKTVVLRSARFDGQPVPNPGVTLEAGRTAVVVTDPQNDFLSPQGVTWGVVGKSVEANKTVEHLDQLMGAARQAGVPVFISPHYYFPHDHAWAFGGALEKMMHAIHMFDRPGALSLEGFEGSGADWLPRLEKHIEDGKTIVTSPHKVYGPESNDLVLQLRKRNVDKVVLAGMSANLCTESHMRALTEAGFEVAVVGDATAAAQTPVGDGYAAAMTNFRYIAAALVDTEEAVAALGELGG